MTKSADVTDEVLAVQERFDRAELDGDRDTLRVLLDDDFLSIGPKGFVLDKEAWIGRHDFFTYHELESSEVDVRAYGGTVIVRNIQSNRATSSGHPVQIVTRVSQVWVRGSEGWRLAAIQFSPAADS